MSVKTRSIKKMEADILHLPVKDIGSTNFRGWWEVRVRVDGVYYYGKKARSYFGALDKSLRVAVREMR